MDNTGYLNGKHYSDYVDEIKKLKREEKYENAIELLFKIIEIIEIESKQENIGVAPWYYEQLAIIFNKQNKIDEEIKILERFKIQLHAPGSKPKKLIERLKNIKNRE